MKVQIWQAWIGMNYFLDSELTIEDWLIKGDKLFYTEISKDRSTIWFAVFPVEFIKDNDSILDKMKYQFIKMDSTIFADSRLIEKADCFESELNFTRQFNGQGKVVLSKKILIKVLDKETILVNDKYYKLDDKLEIFHSFIGY